MRADSELLEIKLFENDARLLYLDQLPYVQSSLSLVSVM